VTLASITACLFGLLAWRVGVRPELLAYSALAAVCVPLATIDVLEQRLPAKLLMPTYPIVAALLALAALMGHNGATAGALGSRWATMGGLPGVRLRAGTVVVPLRVGAAASIWP
jgi:hypothetical protein